MQERHFALEPLAGLVLPELEDAEAVERPAVARGDHGELLAGFGQRDVKAGLAAGPAVEQELEREGRLPGSGRAFDEIDPAAHETATEYVVKARYAGRGALRRSRFAGQPDLLMHGSPRRSKWTDRVARQSGPRREADIGTVTDAPSRVQNRELGMVL